MSSLFLSSHSTVRCYCVNLFCLSPGIAAMEKIKSFAEKNMCELNNFWARSLVRQTMKRRKKRWWTRRWANIRWPRGRAPVCGICKLKTKDTYGMSERARERREKEIVKRNTWWLRSYVADSMNWCVRCASEANALSSLAHHMPHRKTIQIQTMWAY